MNLLEVKSVSKTYGRGETAVFALKNARFFASQGDCIIEEASRKYEQTIIMITHNQNIVQTADRILEVSDGILTDLGRCYE